MRKILVLLLAICAASPAFADWTGKDATGATITFKNPNVCTSVVCVPIASLVDATGAAVGTAGAPLRIDPTGTTTQPVSAVALPLPAGAATSALQTTANTSLSTIATNTSSPIPIGANVIGKVGIDQTTPGTTNGVVVNAGTNTIGNIGVDPSAGKGTPSSVAINVSTATTTQLVAISGSTAIYVTAYDVISGGTGNITFEYGTGASCGTGTTALTGPYNLTAQTGLAKGNGAAMVLKVPAGNALCVLTSAAVQMSGSVTFQQF
jgi:hypothetical protein